MKQLFFTVIIILAATATLSAQYTVETVPNPNTNGWFVANPDDIISQETVDELNSIIETTHNAGEVQVAVVVLNSIGEKVPKEFANELFNYWGVGDASTNNGLLILLVLDQRTVSFETGYGIEESLTDLECYDIQQEFMIPYFKENKYGLGLIEGTKAAIEEASGGSALSENRPSNYDNDYGESSEDDEVALYIFIGFFVLVYFYMLYYYTNKYIKALKQTRKETDLHANYKTLYPHSNFVLAIFFPLPFIFIVIFTHIKLKKLRNTPRISSTGKIMHRLDEQADDEYLDAGNVLEEQLKSVDYDVWVTDDRDEIIVLDYKRKFSKYSECPKCDYITYYLVYDKVIKPATTKSTGTGEKKYFCKYCGYSKISTYTIPMESPSGGSSSGGSSGGGGSWGGGSSGGGGASSSW